MKKIIVFALLSAFLFMGCASRESVDSTTTTTGKTASTYTQITMDEAVQIMNSDKDYLIVDVRTKEEYEVGHIPGAVLVPNETIKENAAADLPDKDRLLLIYCRSGNRSKQASQVLADLGYTNVKEFGGIKDWTGETVTGAE